jgi:hypothetical protein
MTSVWLWRRGLRGAAATSFLLNYAVLVQIGGRPIETMHITATFPDQGSDTANEQQAIVRAKHLARIFINSR